MASSKKELFSKGNRGSLQPFNDAVAGPSSSGLPPAFHTPAALVSKQIRISSQGLNAHLTSPPASPKKGRPQSPMQLSPARYERHRSSSTVPSSGRNRLSIPMYEEILSPPVLLGEVTKNENYNRSFFANSSFASIQNKNQYNPNKDTQKQARQLAAGRKDLSNYPPCQTFKLDLPGTRIYAAGNEITGETVIATTTDNCIVIYTIKLKELKTLQQSESSLTPKVDEKFELTLVQKIDSIRKISCFSLCSLVSVTLPPLKLIYAMAPMKSTTIYVYRQLDGEEIPEYFNIQDISGESQPLRGVENHVPCTKIAIEGENEYMACLLSNQTVVVWDLKTYTKFVTFILSSHGVHVEWHKSEPYKLMVVEGTGWVKFFNVYKQSCFMSINTGRAPLYSADWAHSNSLLTATGWSGGFSIINCSQLNSNMHKTFETPQLNVSKVKFNPMDHKVLATFSRSPGVIRLWRQNFMSHIWCHNNKVDDIAWMHGQPYLLAIGNRKLYLYEASVL